MSDHARPLLPAPIVTMVLIGACALVYAIEVVLGAAPMSPTPAQLLDVGGNAAAFTLADQPWRLGTAMFLHAGAIHLIMNMIGLWAGGGLAERMYGRAGYVALYLFSGLAGGVATVSHTVDVVSVGASGAIFGVFGGIGAWLVAHRERIDPTALRAQARGLAMFIALNLIIGASVPGIDMGAHVGGAVGGFLFGLALEWRRRRARAPLRLALATLLGAGAIAGGLSALPAPPRLGAVHIEIYTEFDRVEPMTIDAFNRLIVEGKAGRLTDDTLAAALDDAILPVWRGMQVRLAAMPPPPPRWLARHQALTAYVDARLAHWTALAALVRGEPLDADRVQELGRTADRALEALDRENRAP
jgi:rhomboid protease GluP